jgi:diaminopimelate decarboxylase
MVGEGLVELTQRRELPEDLLQLDVLPDRFIPRN